MKKLITWDLISITFVISIAVCGSCVVLLLALDLTARENLLYILIAGSTFFTSLALYFEIRRRIKNYRD